MARQPRPAPRVRLAGPSRVAERLVAAFMMGLALFMPPLLAVFGKGGTVAGVPLLYLYLFAAWVGLIAVLAAIVERTAADGEQAGGDEEG